MFGILMVVLGVFLVGYLVVKKYYAPWALFLVGLILLTVVAFGMGAPGREEVHGFRDLRHYGSVHEHF